MRNAAGKFWHGWKRVAATVGSFQARLILSLFYFAVFAPFALAVRWGTDPLGLKKRAEPAWHSRPKSSGAALEQAAR